MSCDNQTSKGGSDGLEVIPATRLFDKSATAWLLSQAVRYLNTADKEGDLAYARVAEILRRCSNDLLETVNGLFRQVKSGDSALRWSLLYVLGDVGDKGAADFLVNAALKQLPEAKEGAGCESDRDMEMLVCTMAIHALHKVANRYSEASQSLLKIISARPAQPILIEAIKVASQLGLKDRVREILSKEDHWILDIRQARIEELFAEPERQDGKERGFTPPKSGSLYTAPRTACCTRKEK
ncbi:MAG: hypothetical protein NG747_05645 [Candidatus Brocadia sp.]|nr:hypothetical protein [Candidatus Brocadia sp.]